MWEWGASGMPLHRAKHLAMWSMTTAFDADISVNPVQYWVLPRSAIYAMYQTLKERKERRACEALREGSQGLTPAVTGTGLDESSRTHSYVEAVEATAGDKIINDGDSGRSNNGGYHDYTSYSGRRARVVVGVHPTYLPIALLCLRSLHTTPCGHTTD